MKEESESLDQFLAALEYELDAFKTAYYNRNYAKRSTWLDRFFTFLEYDGNGNFKSALAIVLNGRIPKEE